MVGFLKPYCQRAHSARGSQARTLSASTAPGAPSGAYTDFAAASSYFLQPSLAEYPQVCEHRLKMCLLLAMHVLMWPTVIFISLLTGWMDAVSLWAEVSFPSVLQGVQQVRRLHDYIIAPLNGLVDERYTIYFDGILNPSDHADFEWRRTNNRHANIALSVGLGLFLILACFIITVGILIDKEEVEKKRKASEGKKAFDAEYASWLEGNRRRVDAYQKIGPTTVTHDVAEIRARQSAQLAQNQLPVVSSSSEAAAFERAVNTSSIVGPNGNVVASDDSAEVSDISLGSGMPMHTADGGVVGAGECKGGSGPSSESSFYMMSGSDLLASDEE